MTGWIIFAAIILVIVLISLIRLGGTIRYGESGIGVSLIAGPVRMQLFPKKPKKPKKPKRGGKKEKEPKMAAQHEKKKPSFEDILGLISLGCEAAGELKRRIRIDRLELSVVWGAEDAASAAIGYGEANAVAGLLWPLIHNNFKVKSCHFHVDVDYGRVAPVIQADGAITLTVGQLVGFALRYGVKFIKLRSRDRKPEKKQEDKTNE